MFFNRVVSFLFVQIMLCILFCFLHGFLYCKVFSSFKQEHVFSYLFFDTKKTTHFSKVFEHYYYYYNFILVCLQKWFLFWGDFPPIALPGHHGHRFAPRDELPDVAGHLLCLALERGRETGAGRHGGRAKKKTFGERKKSRKTCFV